jgi:hypothetical protein
MTTAMALPFTTPATAGADRALLERSAGRLLGRLGPLGYVVLPDGVVVGPTGVAVVATLTTWPGPHDLARLRKRVLQVRTVAAASGPGLPVRALVATVGRSAPAELVGAGDVEVCSEPDLAERIRTGAPALAFEAVLQLAKDLEAATRRWSGRPSFRSRRC